MNWIELNSLQQLSEIKKLFESRPQVIFKHSTRCAASSLAKNRFEKATPPASADFYYLDLLRFRSLSNQVAEDFSVYHESPQVLLIKNAACVYAESHSGIDMEDLLLQVHSVDL